MAQDPCDKRSVSILNQIKGAAVAGLICAVAIWYANSLTNARERICILETAVETKVGAMENRIGRMEQSIDKVSDAIIDLGKDLKEDLNQIRQDQVLR